MTTRPGREEHRAPVASAQTAAAGRIRPWIATALAGATLALAAARTPAEVSSGEAAAGVAERAGPAPMDGCEGPRPPAPGHGEGEEATPLPPGHPPVDHRPALPPGHPPVSTMPRLPAGHPPVRFGTTGAAEFVPGFLTTL